MHVTLGVDQKSGNLTAFVDQQVSGGVQRGIASYGKGMPDRLQRMQANYRKRYS